MRKKSRNACHAHTVRVGGVSEGGVDSRVTERASVGSRQREREVDRRGEGEGSQRGNSLPLPRVANAVFKSQTRNTQQTASLLPLTLLLLK